MAVNKSLLVASLAHIAAKAIKGDKRLVIESPLVYNPEIWPMKLSDFNEPWKRKGKKPASKRK